MEQSSLVDNEVASPMEEVATLPPTSGHGQGTTNFMTDLSMMDLSMFSIPWTNSMN